MTVGVPGAEFAVAAPLRSGVVAVVVPGSLALISVTEAAAFCDNSCADCRREAPNWEKREKPPPALGSAYRLKLARDDSKGERIMKGTAQERLLTRGSFGLSNAPYYWHRVGSGR